jgi:2-methylcitrate dehydratase PrpD
VSSARLARYGLGDARHFVAGNRGLSEWLFTGTAAEGKKVEVNGILLLAWAAPGRYTDEACAGKWW